MRIAILSYEYPPDTGFGGIGTYAYYHARALVKLGHQVRVFAGSTTPGTYQSEHDGVRVTRSMHQGLLHHMLRPARQRRWFWFNNRVETAHAAWKALREALHGERFDAVEAPECGADAAAISMLLDVPLAIRFHSPARLIMDGYELPQRDRDLTAWVEQIAIDRADVRTSCSAFVAREVQQKMAVPPPVHVIPNGIDVELFDRDPGIDVAERFGVPPGATVIFFANRMEERKGVHLIADIALDVLPRHPDVHLVLAGRDLFGYLEAKVLPRMAAAGLLDRVHVLGGVDLAAVRALLKRADIFLLASRWENCPYSCIEAMTAGRAIVSSDCAGMPELVVDRHNGLLARNEDAASFARALNELVEDRELRAALGAAARRTVEERLTDVDIAQRTVDLYRSALSIRDTAAPVPVGTDMAPAERRR